MAKRILVAGGSGFIGSHLCEKLLEEKNNEVICLDNFYTSSKENIAHLLENKNFSLIEHDVINPLEYKVDEIYNLACPASPIHYQKNPIETIKTCFIGTLNLLDLAIKNNAKILQASTSEIYGDPKVHPQKEDYWGNVNPIGIRSCYDEGKRAAETLMFDYHRSKNARIKLVRIFNTYGPKMEIQDGRVVSNFIVQSLLNKDITIYGDGSQTRSFCYVDDLVCALIKMMNSKDEFLGPVNLGNPSERTILELAQLIIKLTNSKSEIIHLEKPKDDPIKRKPDIELAKNELNWDACVDVEEGLLKTIEYFKNKLNKNTLVEYLK